MKGLWTLLIITGLCHAVLGTVVLDETENSDEVTCFTCTESASNAVCNRYALDRPCASGLTFCQTVHTMDGTGVTLTVAKRCVSAHECIWDQVGCVITDENARQMCIACCDYSYCNDFVPTNRSTAVIIRTKGNGGDSTSVRGKCPLLLLPCLALVPLFSWTL